MKLILVRHGETVLNAEGRTQGTSDSELSETGVLQAKLLGYSLSGEKVDAVYASDLKRAVATAKEIARSHDLEVQIDPDLREMNQGVFEGKRVQDMRGDYPDFFRQWTAWPATARMPEGETLIELQERAWRAVERMVERHPQGTVVALSHNFCIHTILCKALNLHLNDFRRLKQDVAAKNVIEFGPRGINVSFFNNTSHLHTFTAPPQVPAPAETLMLKVIRERRSVRRMQSTPIPEDHLTSILEAARLAPSWGNRQCWRFVVVRDAERRARLSRAISTPKTLLVEAPVVIVAFAQPDASGRREGLDYFMLDMGIAVEHLVLQAHALGLGTCWIGLFEEEPIKEAIGLPDDMRVVALIPIGYPAHDPGTRKRKPLAELVFQESF
ncbi:MAG: histidine phosphatase family protein [Chloroflexi bacterium]|nr:histidine phosphatase family protein [Chloroflexota bacterium]